MKIENYISRNEVKVLKALFTLTFVFTASGICSKFIRGYNSAIFDEQIRLAVAANSSISFTISDCYNYFNHPAIFTLFSIFVFLFSITVKKYTKTNYFSVISFCFLSLLILQATYFHSWFAEIVNIEWNSALILSDVFDAILYFCFAIILIFQFKIIYRFTRERLRVKISLK